MSNVKAVAKHYLNNGLSIIPVGDDKRARIQWKEYQSRIMSEPEFERYFSQANSFAVVCGAVSGNLEVMDFDLKYDRSGNLWNDFCDELKSLDLELWNTINQGVVTTKNKGKHIYYQCDEVDGNKVLSKNSDNQVLIETRGEGGYVVSPPSDGYSPDFGTLLINGITPNQRELLHRLAGRFNHKEQLLSPKTEASNYVQTITPWDEYNSQTSNVDLLQSYGWTVTKSDNQRTYLKRPGDTTSENSGNVLHSSGLFYCHSTSTELPSDKGLTPYAVLTHLEFGGDFSKSASFLLSKGFGAKHTTAPPLRKEVPEVPSLTGQVAESSEIIRELNSCQVHSGMILGKPIPIIAVRGQTISTAGNLTGIIGASKAGKSALIQAGLAGCFNREGKAIDTLGLDVLPSDGKLVLHFDTEQSIYDHQRGIKSALKRGGWDVEPEYFKSYNITGRDVEWCRKALWNAGNHYGQVYGGIHSIWLDGPADFLTSVNDEKESNAFVLDLLMFARQSQCPIISTLHFNPESQTKGRGHLGSSFERKCQSVLSVTKSDDEGLSKYEPLKGLLRSSSGFQPFTFKYSEAEGYHVSRGFIMNKKEAERIEVLDDLWNIFDGGTVSFSYSDLVATIEEVYHIKNNSAKKKIASLCKRGFLSKHFQGKKPFYSFIGGKVDVG